MSDILNLANCASPDSVFNVGVAPCDLAKKKMKGVIFADSGTSFAGSEIASVAAFIQAVKDKTTAARGGRVYPVWDILNFEDNTGDPSTGGIGNLTTATIIVQDAIPSFRFGYNGREARHRRMAAMVGASLDVFFVDEQYAVYGTDDGNGGVKGFSVLQAYADTSKFIVADAINQYSFRITLGSIAEYRDTSLYVVANVGLLAALGLVNVTLKEASLVSNVASFYIIADGGTDLGSLYGAIIDGETFTARRLDTNAAVTITSVAYAAGVLAITLDSATWTGLPSDTQVQITPPSAQDLADAAVRPYEILPVIVTKP